MDKPFPAYTGDEPYVFVCYAHEDQRSIYPQIAWLHEQGINIWYDEGISPGEEWSEELGRAIANAERFLFFVTPASVASRHCRDEVHFAKNHETPILAVYLENTELPAGIELAVGASQAILAHDLSKTVYRTKLSDALGMATAATASTLVEWPSPRARGKSLWWGTAVAVALMVGGLTYWFMTDRTPGSPQFERSIVVLPFAVTETDQSLVSYASGLTQELRNRITGYQELQLIVDANAEQRTAVDPRTTSYFVNGSAQRIGDILRVRVQLIRSADAQAVWSQTYDEADDDLADPSALATTMGRFIRLQLVQDQQCEAVKHKSRSAEAARLVCAAQEQHFRINQAGGFDPQLMRVNAERAVSLDPDLLEGYQELPIAYLFLVVYRQLTVDEGVQLAHDAMRQAFAFDSDNAYTLYGLGLVQSVLNYDYDSAEISFRKAIANEPLHPSAHKFHDGLARIEVRRGNLLSALEHFNRAVNIFDSDGREFAEYANTLYFAGQHRAAIEAADRAYSLSASALYYWYLTRAKFYSQLSLGDKTQAMATLNRYLASAEPGWKSFAAGMLAFAGRTAEARRSILDLESRTRPSAYPLLLAYLSLGDYDKAFEWARRGVDASDIMLVNIRIDPTFDSLRQDARWSELIERLEREEAKGRARSQKYAVH